MSKRKENKAKIQYQGSVKSWNWEEKKVIFLRGARCFILFSFAVEYLVDTFK